MTTTLGELWLDDYEMVTDLVNSLTMGEGYDTTGHWAEDIPALEQTAAVFAHAAAILRMAVAGEVAREAWFAERLRQYERELVEWLDKLEQRSALEQPHDLEHSEDAEPITREHSGDAELITRIRSYLASCRRLLRLITDDELSKGDDA